MNPVAGQELRLGPTSASERILALDVLRGFALFGVFLTNAFVSARPFAAALQPPREGTETDLAAWAIFDGLLVMKFVTLFSVLFGMGLVLQMQRAQERGLPFRGAYLRRLAILAGMGLLHGCLLFEGDILLPYAFVGALLFVLRHRSARTLARLALIPFAIGLLLMIVWEMSGLDLAGGGGGGGEFDSLVERARRTGPFTLLLKVRPLEYLGWLVISSLISFNWRVVGLFFLGAALMKQGLLGREHARLHRQSLVAGLGIGGALEILAVVLTLADPPAGSLRGLLGVLAAEIGSLLLSAGYAALVIQAVHSGISTRLQHGLAALGRTALTNYLFQSVAMNLMFFTIGLGLYDELSRMEVLAWTTVIFAVQILASVLWLRAFTMGPIEWVWRSLTYGRAVTLRKRD